MRQDTPLSRSITPTRCQRASPLSDQPIILIIDYCASACTGLALPTSASLLLHLVCAWSLLQPLFLLPFRRAPRSPVRPYLASHPYLPCNAQRTSSLMEHLLEAPFPGDSRFCNDQYIIVLPSERIHEHRYVICREIIDTIYGPRSNSTFK